MMCSSAFLGRKKKLGKGKDGTVTGLSGECSWVWGGAWTRVIDTEQFGMQEGS
jgi:hypothetical protein